MVTKSKSKTSKQICNKCKKEQVLTNYYNADTDFFPSGKLHICKTCCGEIIEEKGFDGFKSLLRLINKPLYSDLYKGDTKDYIRQINSLPQYKLNTYDDSTLFDEPRSLSVIQSIKPKELSEDELNDLIDFFGEGFEEKDYIYLKSEYDDYLDRYEVDSKALENLIKEICLKQLEIRVKRAQGEKVDQQQKTLQDLLGSSNLKPAQETGNQAVEQETFGTLIKKWENERPLPKPDPEWEDVNGIRRLIIWFVGHMAAMSGHKNPYQKEYEAEVEKYEVYRDAMEDDS